MDCYDDDGVHRRQGRSPAQVKANEEIAGWVAWGVVLLALFATIWVVLT